MEEHFYRDRLKKHFDIDVLVPAEDERAIVHRIIYDELCRGKIAIPSHQAYLEIIEKLTERGAEGIVLGCTELPLLIRPGDTHVSVFDTTSKWSQLRAVENKQVFLRPDNPFSWFDGPPGPCQIVGMYWMVNKLYPDKTTELDLKAKVKEFYSKFFHYDLTDDEIVYLLDTQR